VQPGFALLLRFVVYDMLTAKTRFRKLQSMQFQKDSHVVFCTVSRGAIVILACGAALVVLFSMPRVWHCIMSDRAANSILQVDDLSQSCRRPSSWRVPRSVS
jgi:hypothetical protein